MNPERILPRYTAKQVIKLYKLGKRDFINANLRGESFEGENLSGINFSGADIHGVNFANATLKGANFSYSKAGIGSHWWTLAHFILSFFFLLILITTATLIYSNFFFYLFIDDNQFKVRLDAIIILWITILIFHFIIATQGLNAKAFGIILSALTTSIVILILIDFSWSSLGFGIGSLVSTFLGLTITTTVAILNSGTIAGKIAFITVVNFLLILSFFITFFVGIEINTYNVFIPVSLFINLGFSFYIWWRTLKNDKKFILVRNAGLFINSIGGTSFHNADLTKCDFTGANLANTNLSKALLTHVCWQEVKNLDYARVGNSILADLKLLRLLVSGNGYKKSYIRANLRGINLQYANLNEANLEGADISGSILRRAKLENANLSEASLLGTDFTGACLTGACLEAWNINSDTLLDKVNCKFVYLIKYQQERIPSSGYFADNEFSKLFQKVISTVILIFRSGVDWKAFVTAFRTVQIKNKDIELSVQSIEDKGDGTTIIRVNVPPNTDKAKIHSEFNLIYQNKLKSLKAQYMAQLKAKEEQILIYREKNSEMLEIIKLLANKPVIIDVDAISESNPMNNNYDFDRTINISNISGDLNANDNALNLGSINNNVTFNINQLQKNNNLKSKELTNLLKNLQTLIENNLTLEQKDKQEALEQVNTIAKSGNDYQNNELKKSANIAIKILKGIFINLPETAKVLEACNKIAKLLGI